MTNCLKQRVTCTIVRNDGRRYVGVNQCAVDGLSECPRVTAGCATGEGYELCGSVHAEVAAAKLAEESKDVPGIAYLEGHTWFCGPCQHALTAVGVNTFHIGEFSEVSDAMRLRIAKSTHGTVGRYSHGCRCNPCKVANSQRCARYYQKRKLKTTRHEARGNHKPQESSRIGEMHHDQGLQRTSPV